MKSIKNGIILSLRKYRSVRKHKYMKNEQRKEKKLEEQDEEVRNKGTRRTRLMWKESDNEKIKKEW